MRFGVALAVWYNAHRMIACREETGKLTAYKNVIK
jgi:hypothetical protein